MKRPNMNESSQRQKLPRHPRGAALMFVLIAVVVVTMLGGALVRAMVLEMRQSRVAVWGAQADWLAEAATRRAAAHLAADANYEGETWHIDKALLDGRHAALVEIAVTESTNTTAGANAAARAVAITARYPTDTPVFVSREKTIQVRLQNIAINNTDTQTGKDAP